MKMSKSEVNKSMLITAVTLEMWHGTYFSIENIKYPNTQSETWTSAKQIGL